MEAKNEFKILSDFLCNVAVAWFSAGVIAPAVGGMRGLEGLLFSTVAIIFCAASLKGAVQFKNLEQYGQQ